jgi:hypothetical protein
VLFFIELGSRQSPDRRRAGDLGDKSWAASSAARWTPQFLCASGVIVRSAESWNSTPAQSPPRAQRDAEKLFPHRCSMYTFEYT